MMYLPTEIDPAATGTALVTSGGQELVDTAVAVAPILVGVLAAFWAIRLVFRKLGLGKAHV